MTDLFKGIEDAINGCMQLVVGAVIVAACVAGLVGYSVGTKTKRSNTMVKVSSEGPVKTLKVVCSKCAYELEYTGEDVESSSVTHMGEMDTHWYIVCPREFCQKKVTVGAWR